MTDVEWEDPGPDPTGTGRRRGPWFAAVKERPGMWALYSRDISRRTVYTLRREWPSFEFKFRRGSVDNRGAIYARWPDRGDGGHQLCKPS